MTTRDLIAIGDFWWWQLTPGRAQSQLRDATNGLAIWYLRHAGQTPVVYVSERMPEMLRGALTQHFARLTPAVRVLAHPEMQDALGMWFAVGRAEVC